jgi:hypothetical protein
MCTLCDQGKPQNHSQLGRRNFLKASTAAAAASAAPGSSPRRPQQRMSTTHRAKAVGPDAAM